MKTRRQVTTWNTQTHEYQQGIISLDNYICKVLLDELSQLVGKFQLWDLSILSVLDQYRLDRILGTMDLRKETAFRN